MKQTPQYQLCQWEKMDRILMEDFNRDNAKVEAALAKQDAALEKYAAALTKFGNCRLWFTTYTGTGECGEAHPNRLTFPGVPLTALVFSSAGEIMPLMPNATSAIRHANTSGDSIIVRWSGNTVTWYSTQTHYAYMQMNSKALYHVLAFYQADTE